jgi:protein TonB
MPDNLFLYQENLVPVNLITGMSRSIDAQDVSKSDKDQNANPGTGPGVSFNTEGYAKAGYMDMLKMKIFKTWQYPEDAINKGKQGDVDISFELNSVGAVMSVGVVKTSGSSSLDSAAVAAVKKSSPFGPFTGDDKQKTLKITGHFCYVLDNY